MTREEKGNHKDMVMQTSHTRDEPPARAQPLKGRGAPATPEAYAVRKDVNVRLTVQAPTEPEEPEHGYGHGV
ncbi:MAG: hypothetical protein ACT4QD_27145 [Acidobacteriota bacterium]